MSLILDALKKARELSEGKNEAARGPAYLESFGFGKTANENRTRRKLLLFCVTPLILLAVILALAGNAWIFQLEKPTLALLPSVLPEAGAHEAVAENTGQPEQEAAPPDIVSNPAATARARVPDNGIRTTPAPSASLPDAAATAAAPVQPLVATNVAPAITPPVLPATAQVPAEAARDPFELGVF